MAAFKLYKNEGHLGKNLQELENCFMDKMNLIGHLLNELLYIKLNELLYILVVYKVYT